MLSDKVPYYILDLLQQAPSVYVEGLGRFEAIFHPALIDLPNSRIKPPYVEPDFKDDPEAPNETLANYIRYVSGPEIGSPEKAIAEFVSTVHENTLDGKTYLIEKFGTFSRSSLGNIRFTPDWDAFNLSFSGLEVLDLRKTEEVKTTTPVFVPPPVTYDFTPEIKEPVSYVPVEPTTVNAVTIEVAPSPPTEEQIRHQERIDESTSRLWWIILTSALVLIAVLCAYLAWDIISNRNRLNDLTQVYQDTSATIRIDEPINTTDTTNTENIPVNTDTSSGEIPPAENTQQPTSSPCYVVVGAFTDPANISKMVDRLTSLGYVSELLKGGSLTRVAIRSSCDQEALQKLLNDARSSINPESWIY
ncbi:MAG: SPOR domain-containing protein [Saprospiraceae bacterium]